ncbi:MULTISPECIES: PilZ domain-containing protein [Halobacteriovorax]|uniref:PilZ domain-containing protein n=1 Tax=Halobacteriovorax vibrionivorans TaxID=2152716 RepID=A0ABY0IHL5_9BACT|nr:MULTISPECIES: PilZ domain-containing protein [Halobacteriovorax]AYF45349.1 type IV pilus assembly protein PilZ [Halobacteriovorax sp. BALOs_7]RZF22433.1 PilZ domain-containing protein [Halobacteriovorax vibrionivorans]TGD47624.1 PilZ domain-containing protein [Halobacteriovorax sp. Y22]
MSRSNRQYLRAPVNQEMLYLCDDYVLKAKCSNISEGGMLISDMGRVPEKSRFHTMISLIQYPEFSKLSTQKLLSIDHSAFDIEVLRCEVDVVRSFEGLSEVEKILLPSIGAKFSEVSSGNMALIKAYVQTFSKNMIYLLTQFENSSKKKGNIVQLRKTAALLGYDSSLKIPLLRAKVLHDYQSLESL